MSTVKTNGVVNKMTKAQLKELLNNNFKAIKSSKNKALVDSLNYTSKAYKEDEKSVTKKDLLDLVKDAMSTLGEKFILEAPTPVENSVKPSGKKLSKKSKTEEVEETEETPEAPKETPKKTSKKKPANKESAVSLSNPEEENTPAVLLAETFKEEIVLSDEGGESKYQIAHDIDSIEKLVEAFNNEETIVFAYYWTPRLLKQFKYSEYVNTPKEFPLDLDVATCIYVSDEGIIAYAVSLYTEAVYIISPSDFEEIQGVRFANGCEFQIYRLVE